MGCFVSDHQPDVAPELGTLDAVFRLSGGHSQGDLYDQRRREPEHEPAESVKTRGSFPNQEAASKLLYLALEHIAQKWTMPIHNWKAALQRFAILLGDRVPKGQI